MTAIKLKTLTKLDLQFGHANSEKLVSLLKDYKIWDENYRTVLDEILKLP